MALVLIKEDGTGRPDANSYVTVAEADAYLAGNYYTDVWRGADDASRTMWLVSAARHIDSQWQFFGRRANDAQALAWPRVLCPDPERAAGPVTWLGLTWTEYVPENEVPQAIREAQIELARVVTSDERTPAVAVGEGMLANGTVKFDVPVRKPVVPAIVAVYLNRFGTRVGAGGEVRLVRA